MKDYDNVYEVITLGAGCFWCVEAVFQRLVGVIDVKSGYSGGDVTKPTYAEVKSGKTGHAEVVQIRYDPGKLPFSKLLEVFFMTHDPTTLNRQGADIGSQYRSAVFYHNSEQKKIAEEIRSMLNNEGIWTDPIVTEITPYSDFYPAEDYHQEYFSNNPDQPYCRVVITPKVQKFEDLFRDYLKN